MAKNSLTEQNKKYLLLLARKSIEYFLENKKIFELPQKEIDIMPPTLKEKKACFVTLSENEELRGCVGHLEAVQPLYQDVIENAVNAAFFDFRFPPLQQSELARIKIEISILTHPKLVSYQTPEDLLNLIEKNKDGVIIKKGQYQATYLPQVWEQISDKEEFLSSLCVKAGLPYNIWKKEKLEVKIYQVDIFKEN